MQNLGAQTKSIMVFSEVAYLCMIKRAREVSKLSCLMTQEVIFNNLEIQQTLMGIITFLELPLENEGQVLSILFP